MVLPGDEEYTEVDLKGEKGQRHRMIMKTCRGNDKDKDKHKDEGLVASEYIYENSKLNDKTIYSKL